MKLNTSLTFAVRVVKLQPIQIKLDRTPGVRCHKIGEVVRQLLFGQIVNLMIKAIPDSADGARIGLNGFGLQAFELQVLQMQLVVLFEICVGQCFHLKITS